MCRYEWHASLRVIFQIFVVDYPLVIVQLQCHIGTNVTYLCKLRKLSLHIMMFFVFSGVDLSGE